MGYAAAHGGYGVLQAAGQLDWLAFQALSVVGALGVRPSVSARQQQASAVAAMAEVRGSRPRRGTRFSTQAVGGARLGDADAAGAVGQCPSAHRWGADMKGESRRYEFASRRNTGHELRNVAGLRACNALPEQRTWPDHGQA